MAKSDVEKQHETKEIKDLKDLINNSTNLYKNNVAFRLKKRNYSNNKDVEYVNITYSEFKSDIHSLGTSLIDLGLENKKIAIISPNRYEWCVSYLSITTGNMVVVPLDKSLPENEIYDLINRSQSSAVIFDIKYKNIFEKIKEENKTNLKHYICMDMDSEKDLGDMLSFKELIKNGDALVKNGDVRHIKANISPEIMSVMVFTSGTTAMSKGVMLSQSNLCANINAFWRAITVKEDDRLLSILPLNHVLESIVFLCVIHSGASIAFCEGLKHIAKNLQEHKVSIIVCVPLIVESMYKKIIQGIENSGKLSTVRFMIKISNLLLKLGIDIRKKLFKSIIEKVRGKIKAYYNTELHLWIKL